MATAPGRTVSWFKLVAFWWSATLILPVPVPLFFAASCFGVGLLVGCPLDVAGIAAGVGALVTFLEGWSYLFRMIIPLMTDSNQAVTWAAIQRRLLIYAALLCSVPIVALIAFPFFLLFDQVPTEIGVGGMAVVTLVFVLLILHEMDGGFVWKYQRGQLVLTEHEVAMKTKLLAKGKQFP